jgi:hypothetical protein
MENGNKLYTPIGKNYPKHPKRIKLGIKLFAQLFLNGFMNSK